MLIDLHVHVAPRGASLEALVARAPEVGLDGLAIVGDDAFADVAAVRGRSALAVLAGAEVTTDRGHYLVFLPALGSDRSAEALFGPRVDGVFPVRDILARVKALGGAAVAAHPYDVSVAHPGGDILFTLANLAAVEAVFSRRPPTYSHAAVEAADTLGLPCVGGSGARDVAELGRAATLFERDVKDEPSLVEALLSGACWPVELTEPPAGLLRRGGSSEGIGAARDGSMPRRRRS